MSTGRSRNVLLINPPPTTPLGLLVAELVKLPPMGLTYLASSLRRHGYEPTILDMRLRTNDRARFEAMFRELRPRVVGISVMTDYVSNSLRLARLVKTIDPDCWVVFGGPHPGFRAAEILNTGLVDVVAAKGDGEAVLVEICAAADSGSRDLEHIRGILFKDGDAIVRTPARPSVDDLHSVPPPAWDLLPLEEYSVPLVHTTRGCIGHCKFCCEGRGAANRIRFRNMADVMEEVKYLYNRGLRLISFSDDNLVISRKRLEALCEELREHCPGLSWTCEARVDTTSVESVKLMIAAGCRAIHYGVESISQETHAQLRKGFALEHLEANIAAAHEAGATSYLTFVLGLPNETEEQIRASFAFAMEMNQRHNAFFAFAILTPYPGSEYGDHPEEYGITVHSRNYDDYNMLTPVISTPHLTQRRLKSLHTELIIEQMKAHKGVMKPSELVRKGLIDQQGRITVSDESFCLARLWAGWPTPANGDRRSRSDLAPLVEHGEP